RGPGDLRGVGALARPGEQRPDRRRRGTLRAGRRARLPALARDRQGGPERPPRRATDRLEDRHPPRHRGAGGRLSAGGRRRGLARTRAADERVVALGSDRSDRNGLLTLLRAGDGDVVRPSLPELDRHTCAGSTAPPACVGAALLGVAERAGAAYRLPVPG